MKGETLAQIERKRSKFRNSVNRDKYYAARTEVTKAVLKGACREAVDFMDKRDFLKSLADASLKEFQMANVDSFEPFLNELQKKLDMISSCDSWAAFMRHEYNSNLPVEYKPLKDVRNEHPEHPYNAIADDYAALALIGTHEILDGVVNFTFAVEKAQQG